MNNNTKYQDKLNVLSGVIREYRKKNKLSQAKLSNKLMLLGIDIPKNSIQRIESGERVIKDYELAGLSKVLNFSIDDVLNDFINNLEK